MLFEYRILGPDGQEQTGSIEAQNEADAKEKLNSMGLSVLEVSEKLDKDIDAEDESEEKKKLKKFFFSGKDVEKQEVEGEIEAASDLDAFKRLVEEFSLDLEWIVEASLPRAVQEARKKGSVKKLDDLAYERGITVEKKLKQKSNDEEEDIIADEEFYKKQKILVNKIETIGRIFKDMLPFIMESSPALGIEVEKKFHTLEKVKMSNNLVYIEEFIDEILTQVTLFFDKNKEAEERFYKELLELRALFSHSAKAKIEKAVSDASTIIKKLYHSVLETLKIKKKKADDSSDHQKKLKALILERREIIRLLFLHAFGVLIKVGDLRKRHVEAFKRLWKQYGSVSKSIKKLEELIEYVKHFHSKDFSPLIKEVHYFSTWLFTFYVIFFAIAEIAITKSKLLSPAFVWKIFHSQFIVTLVFTLFLILLVSPYMGKNISKNVSRIVGMYALVGFLSVIFYYNF